MKSKIIIFTLLIFIFISLTSIVNANGEGEGGSSEGTTAVVTQKSNITKEKFIEPETEFKKLDRFLRSIFIVNNTDESKEYLGFYIGLTEADSNEEFKNILEEKGLIITYSIGHIYLVFTPDNLEQKIDEVSNLPFVEWINKNAEKVIPIDSTQKISIFIALNQSDNVSKFPKIIGGKTLYVYDQPGELGRILEQSGVEIINYEEDLKGYTANATLDIIKELINLDFVTHIAKEKVFGVAGEDASQIESTAEKIPEKETGVNISKEEPTTAIIENKTAKEKKIEEESKTILLEQKEETKEKQSESLFLRFINFLKSLFGFR